MKISLKKETIQFSLIYVGHKNENVVKKLREMLKFKLAFNFELVMSEHSPFLTNGTDSVTMSDSSGKTDRYRYHLTYHVKLHTGASQKKKITGDVKTLFLLIHPLRIAHIMGKISRAKIFC